MGAANARFSESQVILMDKSQSNPIFIETLHISCRSDKLTPVGMFAGIIFYQYDGKSDFTFPNGVHIRSGYMYIVKTETLDANKALDGQDGVVHGRAFMNLTGLPIDEKFVGGGFSIQNGKIIGNSAVCNIGGEYHDDCKRMSDVELVFLEKAIENWMDNDQQNYHVSCG
jgi:hypothetical protein